MSVGELEDDGDNLYYLDPGDLVLGSVQDGWLRHTLLHDKRCCGRGCGGLRPPYYGEPIDVPFDRKPKVSMLYLPLATVVSRRLWRIIGGFIDDAVLGQCLDVVSGDSYDDYLTAYVPQNLSCSFEYDDVSQELEVRVCKYCKSRKYREEPVSMVPRVARVRAGQRAGFIDSHSGIVVDGELMLLVKEQCVDLDVVAYPRMGR